MVGKVVNAKATVKGDMNKVKRLQYLLTHSFYAKAEKVYPMRGISPYRKHAIYW
jgi:hypothetical protein